MPQIHQVHLDFETRSEVSVTDVGAWVYSRHPSTEILCLSYALDDYPVHLIDYYEIRREIARLRGSNTPPSAKLATLRSLAFNPEVLFAAHNSFFENCIWKNIFVACFGMPEIPIRRWRCTAAKAAAMSLPRDLAGVGSALELPLQKDNEGYKAMMKLSKPRRASRTNPDRFWEPNTAPEDFDKLYRYNIIDVETERLVDKALPNLNPREQEIWYVDQAINMRGVKLDIATVNNILDFISKTVQTLTDKFVELVDYQLESPSQVAKLLDWCNTNGADLPNMQAATVDKYLKRTDVPDNVRGALEIRRALGKISTSKYEAMLNRVDYEDGCLRDILLYCAALTHRWGGRGVQIQNLPRPTKEFNGRMLNSDTCIDIISLGDFDLFSMLYPKPMDAYSTCIRGSFVARPGHDLIVDDLSAIEARVLTWLAGQDSTLELFRNDEDVYCHSASQTYNRVITPMDDYERSVGKVQELALGYEGGIGAFGTMARGYDVDLRPAYYALWPTTTVDERERANRSYKGYIKRCEKAGEIDPLDLESGLAADVVKQRWRIKNPVVVEFWRELERAAVNAVLNPMQSFTVGGENGRPAITFGMWKTYLLMRLPSGNCLVYPRAKVSEKETPWGHVKQTLSYYMQDSVTYQYVRTWTYGGKLAENATQAVARDILADKLVIFESASAYGYSCDYPVVMHVHDEAVSEVPEGVGSLKEHQEIMSITPDWAPGLPLKAKAFRTKRYRK